ncbi:MAG: type VI secretion system baseplate subunit TssE [Pseudomonadota bacterium]
MNNDKVYAASVWHRLLAAGDSDRPANEVRLTLDELKASVARDLEDLLNTRVALPPGHLDDYPLCRRSIYNYGLEDFAALCLTSSEDRKLICTYIEKAIERFEPRLGDVVAKVATHDGAINRLDFLISGTLKAHSTSRRVEFNAMLQPSTLHYSVSLPNQARPRKAAE